MVADRTVAHIDDVTAEEVYLAQHDPMAVTAVALGGIRTLLGVPLLNKGEMIGAFFLSRREVRPFTEKQIELVQELRGSSCHRHRERAVAQRTASAHYRPERADLTKRWSSRPPRLRCSRLSQALPAILSQCSRPCWRTQRGFATLNSAISSVGTATLCTYCDAQYAACLRRSSQASATAAPSEPCLCSHAVGKSSVSLPADMSDIPKTLLPQRSGVVAAVELGGVRTFFAVPMLKDDELIGAFIVYRQEVRPFSDKQIALVRNFAAQAVIAIENARLLNELRQRTTDLGERTADLTEALEQQTATSEVLQVISSSPGDLQPVFATMLEKAVRLCDATFGDIYRWDGDALRLIASYNTPPAFADDRRFH